MQIGTCISKKNKIESGFLNINYQSKSTKLPIKIIQGKESGKTAFISAGMHGDELNGINIVSNFLKKIKPKDINGTLIIAPILNPIGFHYGERRIRYDEKDLNRCFNKPTNSFSIKLANTFFKEVVSQSDFGLDFHDSNKKYILLPHTRIFQKEYKEVNELSRYFGTEIVMKRKQPKRGMLAYEAVKKKIPVLTIEIGGGMNVLPQYLNEGIRGINSVLTQKKILDKEIIVPETQFILSNRLGYKAKVEGILSINKKLGNLVEKKDTLAEIYSPVSEKNYKIEAKDPGVLFSIKASSHIKTNENALSVLHFKRSKGKIIPTDGQMVINKETSLIHLDHSGMFNKAVDIMKETSSNFFSALLKE